MIWAKHRVSILHSPFSLVLLLLPFLCRQISFETCATRLTSGTSDYGIINENLRNTNPTTGELLKYGCLEDVEQVLAGNHGRVAAIIMECIHGKKR